MPVVNEIPAQKVALNQWIIGTLEPSFLLSLYKTPFE